MDLLLFKCTFNKLKLRQVHHILPLSCSNLYRLSKAKLRQTKHNNPNCISNSKGIFWILKDWKTLLRFETRIQIWTNKTYFNHMSRRNGIEEEEKNKIWGKIKIWNKDQNLEKNCPPPVPLQNNSHYHPNPNHDHQNHNDHNDRQFSARVPLCHQNHNHSHYHPLELELSSWSWSSKSQRSVLRTSSTLSTRDCRTLDTREASRTQENSRLILR